MTAGPDGFRDPVPNKHAASRAVTLDGFSGSSVLPIVISFCSFTPASTRGRAKHWQVLTNRPRVVVAYAVQAILLFSHVRSPLVARSPAAPRNRVRQSPGGPRRLRCPVVVRQCFQPCGILGLEFDEPGDGVVPALNPASAVGPTANANDRCAIGVRG